MDNLSKSKVVIDTRRYIIYEALNCDDRNFGGPKILLLINIMSCKVMGQFY